MLELGQIQPGINFWKSQRNQNSKHHPSRKSSIHSQISVQFSFTNTVCQNVEQLVSFYYDAFFYLFINSEVRVSILESVQDLTFVYDIQKYQNWTSTC